MRILWRYITSKAEGLYLDVKNWISIYHAMEWFITLVQISDQSHNCFIAWEILILLFHIKVQPPSF